MNTTTEVIHGHVAVHILEDDGLFPNNPRFPLLVYKRSIHLHPGDEAEAIIDLFKKNNWSNTWKDSIYNYDHYHSTTHEVLAVYCGTADVHLGGPGGVTLELTRGDVLIIPAGVAHKCMNSSNDFVCVGAYPEGREYDMNYGKPEERDRAIANIKNVPVPQTDPIFGTSGGLNEFWSKV